MKAKTRNEMIEGVSFFDSLSRYPPLNTLELTRWLSEKARVLKG
jgi:hypothetical protein